METLNRTQLIYALRPKIHSRDMYQEALGFPTPVLKGILSFYEAGGTTEELKAYLWPHKAPSFEVHIESYMPAPKQLDAIRPFDMPRQKVSTIIRG